MTTTIAIGNQKGGVAKTTTTLSLGAALADLGHGVLLVDLDPQGNDADSLGLEPGDDLAKLLSPFNPIELERCITPTGRERLGVIRSYRLASQLKKALAAQDFSEFVLATALDKAVDWDVVILDCAPSVDILHTAALVAADLLIVPAQLSQLSTKGIRDLLVTVNSLHKAQRSQCRLAGILPTMLDRRTNESIMQLKNLVANLGAKVWPPIPYDIHVQEAARAGKTLFEFNPRTRALIGVPSPDGSTYIGGYMQAIARLEREL